MKKNVALSPYEIRLDARNSPLLRVSERCMKSDVTSLINTQKKMSSEGTNYDDTDYLQMDVNCEKRDWTDRRPSLEDDDRWHEEQLNRNSFIEKAINQYVNNFTLHGLTKVLTASTKVESFFWLVMLLGGIFISAYVTLGLVDRYLHFDVYTDVRYQVTDKNYFPTVTICDKKHLYKSYYSYCGHFVNNPKNETCRKKTYVIHDVDVSGDGKSWWSNGVFNVTYCNTWGAKSCANKFYLKSLRRYDHACFSWNYNGDMHDVYSHVDIEFSVIENSHQTAYPTIIFMAHDPLISEIDLTKAIAIEPKLYTITLEKTMINRLPYPFPSQCSNGKHGDIFPGKYTRRNCIESHNYIGMYKECGDTIDYVRMFIPDYLKEKYGTDKPLKETRRCMYIYGTREANSSTLDCPFPCTEIDISALVSSRAYFPDELERLNDTYSMGFQYSKVDSYKVIKEMQLYSGYQMACEIGGLIGLLVGSSLLSGVEIIVCSILHIYRTVRKPQRLVYS